MDVGCYCVSGARLLAGEPERVFGEQVLGTSGVDVDFHGTLRFPGDVVAQFDASFSLPERQRMEAVGDSGTLVLEAPWRADWGGRLLVNDEPVDVPVADSYEHELLNFAAAIAGEAEPLLGREDALGQARVIEALYASAESGEAVRAVRTSLGIWALGTMATRFVPGGYKPEFAGEIDHPARRPRGRGTRGADRRLRVPLPPGALAGEPGRGAGRARQPWDLHHLHRAPSRFALWEGRPRLDRSRDPQGGARADARGGRLRRRARRPFRRLAGDRGLQLPLPDALRRELGVVRGGDRPGGGALRDSRDQALPRAQELRAGDEDPDAKRSG